MSAGAKKTFSQWNEELCIQPQPALRAGHAEKDGFENNAIDSGPKRCPFTKRAAFIGASVAAVLVAAMAYLYACHYKTFGDFGSVDFHVSLKSLRKMVTVDDTNGTIFENFGRGVLIPQLFKGKSLAAKRAGNGAKKPKEPILILISIDGFRADYLNRGVSPVLKELSNNGLSAQYMVPSFPSSTFPNHYSIVTGLYPESHGIVANQFWDPESNSVFIHTNNTIASESKWWGGEPIWATLENNGIRTAVDMWPGSLAKIRNTRPWKVRGYDPTVSPRQKMDEILKLLRHPAAERPRFFATYIPEVDMAGHWYSPESPLVNAAITAVDSAIGSLIQGLARMHLLDCVDLVVLSDHGMAAADKNSNIIDFDLLFRNRPDIKANILGVQGSPLANVWFSSDLSAVGAVDYLSDMATHSNFLVYNKTSVPERLHYSKSSRIAPVLLLPKSPWIFSYDQYSLHSNETCDAFSAANNSTLFGVHGFDNLDPKMRAIFLASGPSFRKSSKSQSHIVHAHSSTQSSAGFNTSLQNKLTLTKRHQAHPPFQNVEVYNLLAAVFKVPPAPSNGTSSFPAWWLA